MALPANLSPSPFGEVFSEVFEKRIVAEAVQQRLHLHADEFSVLNTADEHVIDWTLSRSVEAIRYVRLLLRCIPRLVDEDVNDAKLEPNTGGRRSAPTASAAVGIETTMSLEEARRWLIVAAENNNGNDAPAARRKRTRAAQLDVVLLHYVVSRLCEVVRVLKELSENRARNGTTQQRNKPDKAHHHGVATMATTFYPDGILLPEWQALLSLLSSPEIDSFVQRGAAFVLASVILGGRQLEQQGRLLSPIDAVIESLLAWLVSALQASSSAPNRLAVVIPSLAMLLSDATIRQRFDEHGGTGCIIRNLKFRQGGAGASSSTMSMQHLYELTFCLWLLSYDCASSDRIRNHFYRCGAAPALVDLVVSAPREKVVRLAVSTLCNLATCGGGGGGGGGSGGDSGGDRSEDGPRRSRSSLLSRRATKFDNAVFLNAMVGCGLLKPIDMMADRESSDPEFSHDLELLHRLLHETCGEMTRWDVYVAEVKSGHLKWGIVHTEKFFKENARRMEGKGGNFEIVKDLLELASGYDDDVAAIACFDIGEFAKHYPNGRMIAKSLGVRDVVMKLIDHENPELQRHSLLCMSKILIHNRQYIGPI